MKRQLWLGAIASALTLATSYALWSLWQARLGGLSLKDEIAAARREGVPLDPADLAAPPVPVHENAAPWYLAATASVKAMGGKTRPMLPKATTVDALAPAARTRLRTRIAAYAPAIAQIRRAGLCPQMALSRRWDLEPTFEDVALLRDLVEVLTVRADLRGLERDRKGAFEDLETAARASALLRGGKCELEGYARGLMETQIVDAAERIVARNPQDRSIPYALRKIVKSFGPPPDLRALLSSQLLGGRSFLAYMAAGGDSCMPGSPWLRLRSVRAANEAYLISYWRYVYAHLPEDPLAFAEAKRAVSDAFQRYDEYDTLRTQGIIIQRLDGFVDRLAAIEARRRVALEAADLLEQWQTSGHLPPRLLHPRQDPFGQGLTYRRERDGFAIYSLDQDRKDDGGKRRRKASSESIDIVWRTARIAPQRSADLSPRSKTGAHSGDEIANRIVYEE